MNKTKEPKEARSLLLMIVSIIMFISGLVSVAVCIVRIIDLSKLPQEPDTLQTDPTPAVAILLLASVLEIFAGAWGFWNRNKPVYADSCKVLGIIIAALILIGNIINAIISPVYFAFVFTAPAVPVLYVIGAIILKKAGAAAVSAKPFKKDPSVPLKIISIIMSVEALAFIILCIVHIIQINKGVSSGFTDEAKPAIAVLFTGALLQIPASCFGLFMSKTPFMIKTDIFMGIVSASLIFSGCFILATIKPAYLIFGFIGAAIPVFYIIGADMLRHQE